MKRFFFATLIFALIIGCSQKSDHFTKIVKVEYKPAQESPFVIAISKGNISKVKSLLKNTDPNEYITDDERPIHFAIKKGKIEIVSLLLDYDLDINATNGDSQTPLHLVSQYGYHKQAMEIIEKGGSVDAVDDKGLTPLHIAIINKRVKLVQLLIANRADLTKRVYKYSRYNRSRKRGGKRSEYRDQTPLSLALKYSNLEIVKILIKKVDLNRKSGRLYPLESAITGNRPDIVEMLLKNGANPNIKKYNPFLFMAVKKNSKEIFDLLIKHGARTSYKSGYYRKSIIQTIIEQKKEGFLSSFLVKEIDPKKRQDYFYLSINKGFLEGVKLFFNQSKINNGNSSKNHLYMAMTRKNPEIFQYLLSKGANPKAHIFSRSLLFQSLLKKQYEISHMLLDTGKVDVNFKDRNRWTPLHAAVSFDSPGIVKKLVEMGAKINAKNSFNITPVISSFYSKNLEITKYLIDKGAVIKGKFGKGLEAVFYAAKSGNFNAFKYLVDEKNQNPNVKDSDGSYPHFSSKEVKIHEYYISKGIDPNYLNKRGRGALYHATYYGHFDVVKYLTKNGADIQKFRGLFNAPLYVAKQKKRKKILNYFHGLEKQKIFKAIENLKPSKKIVSKRFVKKEGYVLDLKTGLMWADGDNGKNIAFKGARNFCTKFKAGKFSDWRVPSIKELKTIYDPTVLNRNGYHVSDRINMTYNSIWSDQEKGNKGARLSFYKGNLVWYGKDKKVFGRALPVRGAIKKTNFKVSIRKIDTQDKDGESYLHKAIHYGAKDLIKVLLDKGADINIIDISGNTPLHLAVSIKNLDMAKYLLDNKASIEKKNRYGRTPLFLACSNEIDKKMVKMLVKKGANTKALNKKGNSLLHELIGKAEKRKRKRRERKDILEFLIKNGAKINIKNSFGKTPLQIAEKKGYTDISMVLYKAGAKNSKSKLHRAVIERNRYKVRRLLKKKGTDINKRDSNKRTALHWAVLNDDSSIVSLLLDKGADPSAKDSDGKTPLYFATIRANYYIIRNLIRKGGDVKIRYNKNTLLHIASNKYRTNNVNKRILSLLIDKGVKINAKDMSGMTALHTIAGSGSTYNAKFLIKKGAKLEIKDSVGWTPLFRAVIYGSPSMVRFLLEKGARKNFKDKYKKTPFQRASKKRLGAKIYNSLKF
jgi:ankyrin repeat protein